MYIYTTHIHGGSPHLHPIIHFYHVLLATCLLLPPLTCHHLKPQNKSTLLCLPSLQQPSKNIHILLGRKEEHIARIRRILEIRTKNNSFFLLLGFLLLLCRCSAASSSPTYHGWTMFRGATDGAGFSSSLS
jgi:hypothetical protein